MLENFPDYIGSKTEMLSNFLDKQQNVRFKKSQIYCTNLVIPVRFLVAIVALIAGRIETPLMILLRKITQGRK